MTERQKKNGNRETERQKTDKRGEWDRQRDRKQREGGKGQRDRKQREREIVTDRDEDTEKINKKQ